MSSTAEPIRENRGQREAGALPEHPGLISDENPPKRGGFVGILQIIAVVAAVSLAVLFSREDAQPASAAAASDFAAAGATQAAAPLVRVMIPQRTATRVTVTATGSVEVHNYVALTPQVGGQVVAVADSLRSGGRFEADEILFRIDPRDYELALAQARSEFAAAESRLKLRQAEGGAARENYALLHGDAPVPDLVAKVPQIEQSLADVAGAQARLAKAELELSRTRYSLPFNGRVTETTVALGQLLSKGQAFGQAFSLEAIEVNVPISQDELARIAPVEGRSAVIRVGSREFPAMVDRVSAQLDERTRFAKLYLTFEGETELPPGTFVDVTVFGAEVADAYILPEASEQAASELWLVSEGSLKRYSPTVYGRVEQGTVVAAFDYGEGVVLGNVPGAVEGLKVSTQSPLVGVLGVGQ